MVKRLLPVVVMILILAGVSPLPGVAGESETSDVIYSLEGISTFGAIEARSGEYAGDPGFLYPDIFPGWDHLMDPAYNRCDVISATLEMTGKHSGVLTTVEQCLSGFYIEPPRDPVMWDVAISSGGMLKMEPVVSDVAELQAITGCAMNGTYPVYHGTFDGEHLYAAARSHGICDGGLFWGVFGIDASDGPLHVTFELVLRVVPG